MLSLSEKFSEENDELLERPEFWRSNDIERGLKQRRSAYQLGLASLGLLILGIVMDERGLYWIGVAMWGLGFATLISGWYNEKKGFEEFSTVTSYLKRQAWKERCGGEQDE